jgi:ADP-heptose:LPS heptosyltransferase
VQIEKRRWAAENFAVLARHVMDKPGRRVILLGGPEEQDLARAFASATTGKMVDLTLQLSIREMAAVLRHCRLLVHNDSSPLHLAGALGTPVLAIFGYQNPSLWGPLGQQDRVVRRDLPCSPCLPWFSCSHSFECIRQLEPASVIEVLETMLGQARPERND